MKNKLVTVALAFKSLGTLQFLLTLIGEVSLIEDALKTVTKQTFNRKWNVVGN